MEGEIKSKGRLNLQSMYFMPNEDEKMNNQSSNDHGIPNHSDDILRNQPVDLIARESIFQDEENKNDEDDVHRLLFPYSIFNDDHRKILIAKAEKTIWNSLKDFCPMELVTPIREAIVRPEDCFKILPVFDKEK